MSRLGDRRAEILEALRAAGVSVATSGRFAAPGVLLEPADPWSEPARMPGRTSRWQLTALAGTPDSDAALLQLADMIDRVDRALRTIDGVGLPTWAKPRDQTIGEIAHGSSVGIFTVSL
jgi:hypothetical protein